MTNREKLWGLCLTAAMEINHHPEIGVTLGGSESGRDVVQMIQLIIYDTIVKGMDFVEPPAPAPLYDMKAHEANLQMCKCGHDYGDHRFASKGCTKCKCVDFEPAPAPAPLNMECACGHQYHIHFQDGTCCECRCKRFDPGPVDRYPLPAPAPAPAPAPPAPAPLVIGLDPLDIQCICGHRYRDHFQDGECHDCKCKKFDSGYVDEQAG